MLNAASQMVGSQESEISTDGRTTAAVSDLQMYKTPLVYPPPKSEMTYIVSGVALNSTHSLWLYVLIGVDNLF